MTDIQKLKVTELKDELKKRGLVTTGLKKDLVERLEAAIASDAGAQQQQQQPEPAAAPASAPIEPPQPTQAAPREAAPQPEKPVEEQPAPPAPPAEPAAPAESAPLAEAAVPPQEEAAAAPAPVEPVQEQRPPSPAPARIQAEEPKAEEAPEAPPAAEDIEVDEPQVEEPAPADQTEANQAGPESIDVDKQLPDPSPARSEREPSPPPDPKRLAAEGLGGMDVDSDTPAPPGERASSALYITGLRRPLQASALAAYLSSAGGTGSADDEYDPPAIRGSAPFVSSAAPNLWLSGIKDHAYFRTWSAASAAKVKEAVDGRKWPPGDVNAGTLHVQFVPDAKVDALAQQEEDGWRNGRQRFELVTDGGGCRLQPLQKLSSAPPPPAPGAARGLLGRMGERMGPTGRPARAGANAVPVSIRGRAGGPVRYTRARPSLAWTPGPGAGPRA